MKEWLSFLTVWLTLVSDWLVKLNNLSNSSFIPQTEESLAEEEVLCEEWVPNHLPRHGKMPHPLFLLGGQHEKVLVFFLC